MENGMHGSFDAVRTKNGLRRALNPLGSQRELIVHSVVCALTVIYYALAHIMLSDQAAFVCTIPLFMIIYNATYTHVTEVSAALLPKTLQRSIPSIPSELTAYTLCPPLVVPLIVRDSRDVEAAADCVSHILSLDYRGEIGAIVLLVDFADSDNEVAVTDMSLRLELDKMLGALGRGVGIPVLAKYRRRAWNAFEGCWMGWERKRGKVVEFLKHTRGLETTFAGSCPSEWLDCAYVMTIDVDTRLEDRTVSSLVAALENAPDLAIASPILKTLDSDTDSLDRSLLEPSFFHPRVCDTSADQLVFGSELFYGKGLIRVDAFLGAASDFPENSVLSHDHLEALIGGACAVASAVIAEPFPPNRHSWERRQHRWFRGDLQIAPWGVLGRSWYSKIADRLPWHARLRALRIAMTPVNLIIRYLVILALFWNSPVEAVYVLIALVIMNEKGVITGVLSLVRNSVDSDHKMTFRRRFGFYLLNAVCRSIGELLYFQRMAVLAFHAASLVFWRMVRGDRRRLLEWYPENPNSVIRARRMIETSIVLGSTVIALCFGEFALPAGLIAVWWLAAAIVSGEHRWGPATA